jgi:predicted ATPase/class 3 adenylate cyclase
VSPRRDLPAGTVTFLFTDIEGSTRLLNELGAEEFEAALSEHRRVIRQTSSARGGIEVDTQGDSFLLAFADAAAAAQAALEAQSALSGGPIRVRMGLHTGHPRLTDEGYVGHDLHLGARIAAAGHGGQVLISRQTRDLAATMPGLPAAIDLGEHRLKDFGEPVWIYQLGPERFPPLKTISNTNLPRPADSFVGRRREVAELRDLLLDGARMLTLTGPGGSGKSRLAIEVAANAIDAFRNGVFWVELTSVRDAALVRPTIGGVIGARDELAGYIGEREMLLVLDNLEQIVDAAPDLADLVGACPRLRLLGTSRELLRVRGEVAYPVRPLDDREAEGLFAARSGIEPDEHVAELCRQLDKLPLAVELAAARASVLSPRQILERIGKRLDLLRAGRGVDPRQQTLRATIGWSYDLLDAHEQRLFARLSVFNGGWTLESAEMVCDADMDVLQSLVDKNLIRFAEERFSMLETIRDYAADQLTAFGETDALGSRHAQYFLGLAEEAEPHVLGTHPAEWLQRLEAEHGNIRTALDWLEGAGETQLALRLSGAIWEFWCLRSLYGEGIQRFSRLLERDRQPTLARAKALTGITHLSSQREGDRVQAWADEAVELYSALGDQWGTAVAEFHRAAIHTDENEFATAARLLEPTIQRLRAAGDEHRALIAMRTLAWCYEELGDKQRQVAMTQELLERALATDDEIMEARALGVLAGVASDEGRHDDALAMLRDTYRLDVQLGDPDEINTDLARIARALALAGHARDAVKLLSVREVTRPDPDAVDEPWIARMHDEALAAAHALLDDRAFDDAWEEGRRTSVDTAVREALFVALGATGARQ